MNINFENKLKKVLNKAYLKKPVTRDELTRFRDQLLRFVDRIDPNQHEEHAKNLLSDFLKDSFYGEFQVNIHDRIDLTIAKGGRAQVLFETKKPGKSTEMMTTAQPNAKALHQTLFYFLNERITNNNLEIKTLIVTDIDHWFLFDAREFEALATKDKQLVRDFESFASGGLLFSKREEFYAQVAKPWFEKKEGALTATIIDLQEIVRSVRHMPEKLESLVPLYKILSPAHLLKEPFQNDSNTLDKNFYGELLYWMGLEEAKEGSKAVIRRPATPQPASLVELILDRLDLDDKLAPGQVAWDVAMELALLWVNRLLFLKLLESQLATYHRNDASYRFMAPGDLKDFDDLYSLFFGVLAVRTTDRREKYAERWARVPYLNSSLFEQSDLEKRILSIDRLDNHAELPVWTRSVLKSGDGKRSSGTRTTLNYLLSFLEAFDFSSEGTGEIQDSGKTLINASVLGLIFEKINGYKEGAFFTPGYITQYMAHQSVQAALITRFNKIKGWDCSNWLELTNQVSRSSKADHLAEANAIVNGLKILDPAVGSGHFLVSVLNELIAAKSELGILMDPQGRLLSRYQATVENDELFLLDQEGEFVVYQSPFLANEPQRVWETIFLEKKALIEGCLFGVDINPNSVQICKLRLWIELLKHAYFTPISGYLELETLPNLDIKIREGNSLVSRYALDVPLNKIGDQGGLMTQYLDLVKAYQETPDKKTKAQIEQHIGMIKDKIKADLEESRPLKRKLELARDKLAALSQDELFGLSEKEKKDRDKKRKPAEAEVASLTAQVEDETRNPIFRNSFEWRFEFPEVLDPATGAFVGFDVVIGNPPYFNVETLGVDSSLVRHLMKEYSDIWQDKSDILFYFILLAMRMSDSQVSVIVSNAFLFAEKASRLRQFILERMPVARIVNFERFFVFPEAGITTAMLFLDRTAKETLAISLPNQNYTNDELTAALRDTSQFLNITLEHDSHFVIARPEIKALDKKIDGNYRKLGELFETGSGMQTGANDVFVFATIPPGFPEGLIRKRMSGDVITPYTILPAKEYLLYVEDSENFESLPQPVREYLHKNESTLKGRADKQRRISATWWNYTFAMHREKYTLPKIWCSYRGSRNAFVLDDSAQYIGLTNTTVIFGTNPKLGLSYLLGLLNSKLLSFRYQRIGKQTGNGIYEYFENGIGRFPIPEPSETKSAAVESLVTQILAAKKTNPDADTQALEDEIDQLVYKLYGLTEDEIAIVEGKS